MNSLYTYRVQEVLKIVDGDTVDVRLDLGFGTFREERLRLMGLDAPETRTRDKLEKAEGLRTKEYVASVLRAAEEVFVKTEKKGPKGKYGRYIAEIWVKLPDQELFNLNHDLLEKGLAKFAEY